MFGINSAAQTTETVRKPAVAGQFYPGSREELRREVERYCAGGASAVGVGKARVLISPHAGYVFSGPVAGKGFAALDRSVTTVILIGPSHHAWFEGLAIPAETAFQTPLGSVPVDKERMKNLMAQGNVKVNSEAHGPEHSLEVQIPFLQVLLRDFAIVPVLTGKIAPQAAADMLFPLVDEKTAVIASTDLSHYLPQDAARNADSRSIQTVLSGREDGPIDACGETPIRVVMTLARRMGLSPKLLDARTSFETCPKFGSNDRVVGYASIVYVKAEKENTATKKTGEQSGLAPDVQKFLLDIARKSLDASVKGEKVSAPELIPAIAKEQRGCFVTLTVKGELRGCIGYIEPIKPLYQAVMENAKNAALSDPRFPRVTPAELSSIKVEVSVLTKPAPLEFKDPQQLLSLLIPGIDGVILEKGPYHSTYLPQVWDHFKGDKVAFLRNLSLKAGMDADGWKTARVKRYQAEHFSEQ